MKRIIKSIRYSLPVILVSILTLMLLAYVGFGEANRKYPIFQLSKLATQGEIIRNSINSYLQAGLPLEQFSGFQQLSQSLMTSDKSMQSIIVIDHNEQIVFDNSKAPNRADDDLFELSALKLPNEKYPVEESDVNYRITLPVESKFGVVGHVRVEADKEAIFSVLTERYKTVFISFVIISILFSLFAMLLEGLSVDLLKRTRLLKIGYAASFIVMSIIIATVVFKIYEIGAQANAKALSDSMASRLNAVVDLGLKFNDLEGVNDAFIDYKESNPEIRGIALVENGISKYHTNSALMGVKHESSNDVYEYLVPLVNENYLKKQQLYVSVTLPTDIVLNAVLSSAKEFITLFIACGLISLIFIDAGAGITAVFNKSSLAKVDQTTTFESGAKTSFRLGLSLIKPAYFLIVFVHALSVSFLPQMVTYLAESTVSNFASASLPFTIYYALFAIVLIPAGQYAEKGKLKPIMALGCFSEVIGLTLIAVTADYWLLVIARAFSGAGQGLFLIGLQSYLLAITPKEQRTQGSAVKVIGRNAGLISGTAIGALLFAFTDYTVVFMIGSGLSVIGMYYLWTLVPEVDEVKQAAGETFRSERRDTKSGVGIADIFHNIYAVMKDKEFVKSLLLVAMPGKMAITGVIMFAVPLSLTKQGFKPEEIGQALMVYYISSIIMTHYASRIVDKFDMSKIIIFISTLLGGGSIVILGLIGEHEISTNSMSIFGLSHLSQFAVQLNVWIASLHVSWVSSIIIMLCLIVAGISNGLLTSPVVTHINKTHVAETRGIKTVTATYTFLERGGHMVGPMFIGYLFTLTNQSNIALSIFGIGTIILGVFFILSAKNI